MIVRFTRRAEHDLDDIYDYLAQKSLDAAEAVIRRIDERCRTLSARSGRGRTVELAGRPDLRRILQPPYTVVYRVGEETVWIVAVAYVSRDLAMMLAALDLD